MDVDENISKLKFIELNNLEVQDEDTTEKDLWTGLKSIGFNNALEIDMVCFNILCIQLYRDVSFMIAIIYRCANLI